MARRALGPATLKVAQAVAAALGAARHPLIVGCSGGADSLALAAGAVHVARRLDIPVSGVVVDHGLQTESAAIARQAAAQASRVGLRCQIVPTEVELGGQGPEGAARTARYAVLDAVAGPRRALVLLGHTLDDQAETVLLGLVRGSGTRSLAGMPQRRGRYLRPLLGLRRSVTRQACTELGLTPWQDPHNDDPVFLRSRIRAQVMPMLEESLGPGVAEALARTAQLAADDADYLDAMSEPFLDTVTLDCTQLAALHAAIRRRVLRRWLIASGAVEPTLAHVVAVEALVVRWRGQKWVDVPGLRVVRRDDQLAAVAG